MFANRIILVLLANSLLVKGSSIAEQKSAILEEKRNQVCEKGLVDAVTTTKNGNTYFFKDDYYWKISDTNRRIAYLRLISDDWKGIEGPIDAALTWTDGTTYIFKEDQYWRLINKVVLPGFPRKIKVDFDKIPNDLDAVLEWHYYSIPLIYFFKGNQYWRYQPKIEKPVGDSYPLLIESYWHKLISPVDAALRLENGETYFFKGQDYFEYKGGVEAVPPQYPLPTLKDWFDCEQQTKRSPNIKWDILKDDNETVPDNAIKRIEE